MRREKCFELKIAVGIFVVVFGKRIIIRFRTMRLFVLFVNYDGMGNLFEKRFELSHFTGHLNISLKKITKPNNSKLESRMDNFMGM